jgi:NAD(P)H-dependent FMN reductase
VAADGTARLLVVLGSVASPGRLRRALEESTALVRKDGELDVEHVFDQLPVPALAGKVVALAAMGASDHHFLGADRHLRDVLSFFGALVTPVSVYLTGADFPDGVTGDRAAGALDQLIVGALELSRAIGEDRLLAPSPLAARAIRR